MARSSWTVTVVRLIFMSLFVGFAAHARPAILPDGFVSELVTGGVFNPTAMTFAPDGRLFITQKTGSVRVFKNGVLLATPFLTVTTDTAVERGLLGLAFDPNFTSQPYLYIYYTVPATATTAPVNRISRFTANGDLAVPGSEVVLLELDALGHGGHNGGDLHFGPDGKLYIAVGDNHTRLNASNAGTFDNLLGKILRLNRDGTIPTDNPFYTQLAGRYRAIWAYGLRNPYRFAFQRGTGRMFVNDVGENRWEEINDGITGANYGWPSTEGETTNPVVRSPLYVYPHPVVGTPYTEDNGCAITGGTFYNPLTAAFPSSYVGKYFFADYCGDWIHVYDPATDSTSPFASGIHYNIDSIPSTVDLDVGPDGALYYLLIRQGAGGLVYRIRAVTNLSPEITAQPSNQTVTVGQPATFSVEASGSGTLGYRWQRDGTDIPGATDATCVLPSTSLTDSGARFRCVVTNAYGSTTSNDAVLTVTENRAPVATITAPAVGTLYSGGDSITYAGTGTDPEDGSLPATAFTWRIDFHHNTHTHPFMEPASGMTGGTLTIPRDGETATDVWFRIHLTVTDRQGMTHSVYRDVVPRKVTLTLATLPSGLTGMVDNEPFPAPYSFDGVVGVMRKLSVESPQTLNGVTYEFVSWSDGGTASHLIQTPTVRTTYTATFRSVTPGSEPIITMPPVNQTVRTAETATFSVTATGATAYRWQRNGADIIGATAPSYTTPPALLADNGATFRCVVSNGGGSVPSSAATLTVVPPPTITRHPIAQTTTAGGTATFSVAATATGTLYYQWQRNGVSITGAKDSIYTTPPATLADDGAAYRCIVRNKVNDLVNSIASMPAVLTVLPLEPPIITAHPVNQTVRTAETATFSVTATGATAYQWQRDGADIPGATASSYTTPPTVFTDNGATFRCVVSNGGGSVPSSAATLTVVPPPTITRHPIAQTTTVGGTATFSVAATATGTLYYQWQRNGVSISGAKDPSYTTPPATLADDGAAYRCIVRNKVNDLVNSIASMPAALTVR